MKIKFLCLSFLLVTSGFAPANVFHVVAAENFYGEVAAQIGASSVKVVSILNNPQQDPHEFQADVATAKLIAQADIVIYNGLGYDDWVERFLAISGKPTRVIIKVADLINVKTGNNPHIWYDPKSMAALATKLGQVLDKPEAAVAFQKSMQPLLNKIAALKSKTSGVKVTATEPIFGYMADILGLNMLNYDYQLAVMNHTDPSFQQSAAFEKSLIDKQVKILFYNNQVIDPLTQRIQSLAKECKIPLVGITETQPPHVKSYVNWMLLELTEVEKALHL